MPLFTALLARDYVFAVLQTRYGVHFVIAVESVQRNAVFIVPETFVVDDLAILVLLIALTADEHLFRSVFLRDIAAELITLVCIMSRCVIFYRGVDGVCQSLIIPNLRPFGRIGGISGDSRVRAGRFIVLCRYGIIDFPSFDKRLLNLPPPVEESLVPLESCVLFELLDCPELLEPSVLLSDVFPLQEPNPDAVPSAMTEHSKKTTTFFFIFFLLVPRRFLIP